MPSRLHASSVRGVNTPLLHPAVSAGGSSASEKLFSCATDREVLSPCCCCGDAVGSTVAGRLRSGEAAEEPTMTRDRCTGVTRVVAAGRGVSSLLWGARHAYLVVTSSGGRHAAQQQQQRQAAAATRSGRLEMQHSQINFFKTEHWLYNSTRGPVGDPESKMKPPGTSKFHLWA